MVVRTTELLGEMGEMGEMGVPRAGGGCHNQVVTSEGAVKLVEYLVEAEEWFGEAWAKFMSYSPDEDVKGPEWNRLSRILNKQYRLVGRKLVRDPQLSEGGRLRELWEPVVAEASDLAAGHHSDGFWDHVRSFEHFAVHGTEYVPEPPVRADDLPF